MASNNKALDYKYIRSMGNTSLFSISLKRSEERPLFQFILVKEMVLKNHRWFYSSLENSLWLGAVENFQFISEIFFFIRADCKYRLFLARICTWAFSRPGIRCPLASLWIGRVLPCSADPGLNRRKLLCGTFIICWKWCVPNLRENADIYFPVINNLFL